MNHFSLWSDLTAPLKNIVLVGYPFYFMGNELIQENWTSAPVHTGIDWQHTKREWCSMLVLLRVDQLKLLNMANVRSLLSKGLLCVGLRWIQPTKFTFWMNYIWYIHNVTFPSKQMVLFQWTGSRSASNVKSNIHIIFRHKIFRNFAWGRFKMELNAENGVFKEIVALFCTRKFIVQY